jgi:hypothetical protein
VISPIERSVADLCASTQFPEEQAHKFVLGKECLKAKLQRDVLSCKQKYESQLKHKIPVLDSDGHLVLDP